MKSTRRVPIDRAPTRVKMRSQMPRRALAAHERTDLVEQHDQRHLAQVGRLAAHVRAGDDLDAVSSRRMLVWLGMKRSAAICSDHRMPSV
jgi:hypothetical protein